MGKRSSNRPVLSGKDRTSCVWGLISIFHFRQGHPIQKLLSNGRHMDKHFIGTGYPKSRLNLLTSFDENCQGINDGADNITLPVDAGESRPATLTVRDTKSSIRPEVSAFRECVCTKYSLTCVSYPKRREFHICLEAKRHLSHRLSNVDRDEILSSKEALKTFGRILCVPQDDSLCTLGPKRNKEYGCSTAQMKFSPYSNLQRASKSSFRLQKENKTSGLNPLRHDVEASPCTDNTEPYDQLQIFDSRFAGYLKNMEANDIAQPGDFGILDVSSSPNSTQTTSAAQNDAIGNSCDEFENLECSRLDSFSEDQPSTSSLDGSSSTPLSIQKLEFDEHPSPVSVLEQVFIEEVTSPPSATPQPAKPPVEPLHTDFDEQARVVSSPNAKINLGTCMEDHGLTSKYAEALLQAFRSNWDELFVRWHTSDQLLNPSLFDEDELCPIDESCCDHKLLFDCSNEVVSEVCRCYFYFSPWLSFLKPRVQLFPADKTVVNKVMKRVNQFILKPRMTSTRDQLVAEDMANSETWMGFPHDTEDIVVQMVESIIEDLVSETIL